MTTPHRIIWTAYTLACNATKYAAVHLFIALNKMPFSRKFRWQQRASTMNDAYHVGLVVASKMVSVLAPHPADPWAETLKTFEKVVKIIDLSCPDRLYDRAERNSFFVEAVRFALALPSYSLRTEYRNVLSAYFPYSQVFIDWERYERLITEITILLDSGYDYPTIRSIMKDELGRIVQVY